MYLYQISGWRNAIIGSSLAAMELELSREFRAVSSVLSNASGAFPHGDPNRPLVAAGGYSLSGSLISGLNGAETATEQYNYLLQLAGRPYQPMIAWLPDRGIGTGQRVYSPDFPGNEPLDVKKDMWVLTYGTINNVSRSSGVNADGGLPTGEAVEVSIDFEAGPYWEPLDYIRWRWRPNGRLEPPYSQVVSFDPPTRQNHPGRLPFDAIMMPNDLDSGFEQILFDTAVYGTTPFLNPYNWCLAYARSADTFYEPYIAKLPTENPNDMIQPIAGGQQSHELYPAPNRWPAAPRSLYYFSNFAISGASLAIQVDVQSATGTYSSTASVDIDDIYTALNELGLDPIKPTDRMIIGGLARTGGYYLRDNGSGVWELVDIFIPWEYGGLYPGETFPGSNEVTVYGPSVTTYSYAHVYRMF
jgi:hypothetical protein